MSLFSHVRLDLRLEGLHSQVGAETGEAMTAKVIHDTTNYRIGRYTRLLVHDDQGDLNPGEQDQAINHVLGIASRSTGGSVEAFEWGLEGAHGAFIFNVRIDQRPSKTMHVTIYRRQAVTG